MENSIPPRRLTRPPTCSVPPPDPGKMPSLPRTSSRTSSPTYDSHIARVILEPPKTPVSLRTEYNPPGLGKLTRFSRDLCLRREGGCHLSSDLKTDSAIHSRQVSHIAHMAPRLRKLLILINYACPLGSFSWQANIPILKPYKHRFCFPTTPVNPHSSQPATAR